MPDTATTTTTTNTSQQATNDNSIWTALFGALPGVLSGTAQVINSTKSGTGNNMYNGYPPAPTVPTTANPNSIWYILGGVALIAVLFFMFKK